MVEGGVSYCREYERNLGEVPGYDSLRGDVRILW